MTATISGAPIRAGEAELVTRGDRRRRELVLESSSPPLKFFDRSANAVRIRDGHKPGGGWVNCPAATQYLRR